MRVLAILLRIVGITTATLLTLLMLALITIQIQNRILRHRAERLLADFHSIRLNQSTWGDAQAIMQRWGEFGHADGPCNPTECGYVIEVGDPLLWHVTNTMSERSLNLLETLHLFSLYEHLGGHAPRIWFTFIVQDAQIVRSSISFAVDVPLGFDSPYGMAVIASARSESSLGGGKGLSYLLDQSAAHPDFQVERPDGCEICKEMDITFTPQLSPSDVDRLTDFNLGCITRFFPCQREEDLLPTAAPWHIYTEHETLFDRTLRTCQVPARALGRDTIAAAEIEVLSNFMSKPPSAPTSALPVQAARVRVLNILKGHPPETPGQEISIMPDSEEDSSFPMPAPISAHTKYLWLFDGDETVDQGLLTYDGICSMLADTQENKNQLMLGISQNDILRRSEYVDTRR